MTSFMKDVVNRGTAAKVRARGSNRSSQEKQEHRVMAGSLVSRRISCARCGSGSRRWLATGLDRSELGPPDLGRLHAGGAREASGVGRRLGRARWCRGNRDQSEDGRTDSTEDTEKRVEFSINGTGPSNAEATDEEEKTVEELPEPSPFTAPATRPRTSAGRASTGPGTAAGEPVLARQHGREHQGDDRRRQREDDHGAGTSTSLRSSSPRRARRRTLPVGSLGSSVDELDRPAAT